MVSSYRTWGRAYLVHLDTDQEGAKVMGVIEEKPLQFPYRTMRFLADSMIDALDQAEDKLRAGRNIMRRLLEDHPGDFPPAYQWLAEVNSILGETDQSSRLER
jgi:hypothetical protein